MGDYNASNTIILYDKKEKHTYMIILYDSKEKHTYNDEMKYIIVNGYSCDHENDIFLSNQLWTCLLQLNGVSGVKPIIKCIELVC